MADKARTTLNDRAHCVLFPASVHLPVDQDDDHDDDRGDDQDDDHDDEDAIDKMILTPFHPTLSGLRLQQGQPV